MTDVSIFATCSATISVEDDTAGFIECISNAQEKFTEEQSASLASGIDSFYLIFAGALVYFMQTGFAMLCAGSIRAKNVKNVLLWNLLDSCGGGLAFWAVGYAFAYGGDEEGGSTTFIGNSNFFLRDGVDYESWFFQFAFACALSSIVAGTIAERCKMTAYLFYSSFLVGFCYPVVAHSFWSYNGFLSNTNADPLWGSGAIDLAGSGPVHMTGGVTALVAAIILGPRLGRFHDRDGNPLEEPAEFPPHSVALQFLGTFCLWFGWYGFNPGSVLAISTADFGDAASLVAVNTTLAACAGAVTAMFTSTLIDERKTGIATYDLGKTMNGCLTGLVAITAGCACVETWAAVVIGIFAGWFYLIGSALLIKFRIDDAVDAIPVHMVGGAWGVIATGLFATPELTLSTFGFDNNVGWFYEWGRGSGNFTLLGIQLVAVLWIMGWTSVIMGFWFYGLNLLGMLRIDPLEEEVGMDISRHKGAAYEYDDGSAKHEHVQQLSQRRLETGDSSSRHSSKALSKDMKKSEQNNEES
mmetsp:Transcript_25631/g.39399  ORF Transcript_25631/g.39399 Transcript_25631/m.39399 type:complete len:526 (-) Transcript_25631:960-2537(-)|eukprot:CAMPEP_0195309638 /NCGR_PEP_ID=MMETSP0707-20130614/38837_1 /TAXON_ID=33640 /ORGANISM="Asterionellopsis glacialis, Strain CCMP134" /LENGTH=525 /DNA_ID=CAMNT_0040373935 /DNA_START=83 /DNA_END=1660 /DNA_ORIENTATION=-